MPAIWRIYTYTQEDYALLNQAHFYAGEIGTYCEERYMMNKSCTFKRILALILVLTSLVCGAPAAMAESYTAIVTDAAFAVYRDAALTQKISDLPAATLATVVAEKDGVLMLYYKGYAVYAANSGISRVDDIAIPGVFSQNTRVFESPDLLSRSAAVSQGLEVNVLMVNGGWAMIERNGRLAYAYASHLTPASGQTQNQGSSQDPFLPEETPDADDSVTIETVGATVSVASLPVYKSASTASAKLGTLKYGQAVTVYAYNANWAYIGLNGRYGFTALAGLQKTSHEEADSNSASIDLSKAIPATVTADSVKVYKSASTSADTLGTLKKGVQVNVVAINGGWAFIELNGKLGYCAASALTKTSELNKDETTDSDAVIGNKSPLGTATVVQASAPVYSALSTSASYFTLSMGETVNYYGYDANWVLVGRDGAFGFVPRKYLSATTYAELDRDDTGDAVKEMENKLLSLGYLDSVPGTTYTAYTADAVSRLQAACGMSATGNADTATLRVLFSGNAPASPLLSASLSKGNSGSNVTRLQTRLYALGYLSRSSSIDGDYGATTANAVALFQTAAGGNASGTANAATIQALYSLSAPKLPSGVNAADVSTGTTSSGSSGNSTNISSGLASTTDQYVSGMSNAQKLEYVIYVAQQQLGKKYVFGSSGTSTFDCSGLTMYCFKQIGVKLAHSAYTQGYGDTYAKVSSKSSLRRGDLVFFNTMSDSDSCDHVGIYLGSNYFIHASSGAGKVVVSDLGSGYYSRVYSWGRRVLSA